MMKLFLLCTTVLIMGGLSGCVPAYYADSPRFGVDTTQQYYYSRGPAIMPLTSY